MLSKPSATSLLPARLLPAINQLQAIPQPVWYKLVCFVLSLLLIVSLVQWVWLLMPEPEAKALPAELSANIASGQRKAAKIDIAKLQSYNLFGSMGTETVLDQPKPQHHQKAVDATPTRLKISLQGIVQASNVDDALAIIEYQGKEDAYGIGDKLPVGRVVLYQIHHDHVIIENAGRYESLWLFDENAFKSNATVNAVTTDPGDAPSSRRDFRTNKHVTSMAESYRKRLYKNPSSLADAIRISPKQDGGELQGYRISPGRDKDQFEQLGLQANDVVTSINGIELNDPAKAVEVYKIMRSAKEATFVLDRAGDQVELVVSLDSEN